MNSTDLADRDEDSESTVDDRMQQALLRQVARSATRELKKDTKLLFGFFSAGHNVSADYLRKRQREKWFKHRAGVMQVPIDSMPVVPDSVMNILRKLIPLGIVFFASSFNLTLLQNIRDALIVTSSGAEVLPFLSSFCVLPASIVFFVYYSSLLAHIPPRRVYYAAVGTLVSLYALFAFVLYPIHPSLHLYAAGDALRSALPAGLHGLATLVQNWTFSLFFCFAEIWGSVCISVLFWGLANDVCTVDDAKTIYPLMGIAANVGLVASGSFMKWAGTIFNATGDIQGLLQMYVLSMIGLTGVMFATKFGIDQLFLGPMSAEDAAEAAEARKLKQLEKKNKPKPTMSERFALLTDSIKIRNLALLVMSYSVAHRLFEFSWKGQLRNLYPTLIEYQSVLANVSIYTGYATIAMMVMGRFVFDYFGWGFAALATPLVMLLSGGFFFASSLAPRLTEVVPMLAGLDPAWLLTAGALAGCVTQVFARSAKFSLFDPAKEMVYIEMSKEEKGRGKAAVDLVGAQVGKSGGAWITQALLLMTGTLSQSLPFVMAAFTGIIVVWIRSARTLETEMLRTEEARMSMMDDEDMGEGEAALA